MKAAFTWVTSLGRKPAKTEVKADDPFEQRLKRLGRREAARVVASAVFKAPGGAVAA